MAQKKTKQPQFNYGTGRRKTSVARAFLKKVKSANDSGITINDRTVEEFFGGCEAKKITITQPLKAVEMQGKFKILVTVKGGGITGQAEAIRLAIARALTEYDEEGKSEEAKADPKAFRRILRTHGYLTRDSRKVERKKVGLHKARKKPQYSKR